MRDLAGFFDLRIRKPNVSIWSTQILASRWFSSFLFHYRPINVVEKINQNLIVWQLSSRRQSMKHGNFGLLCSYHIQWINCVCLTKWRWRKWVKRISIYSALKKLFFFFKLHLISMKLSRITCNSGLDPATPRALTLLWRALVFGEATIFSL